MHLAPGDLVHVHAAWSEPPAAGFRTMKGGLLVPAPKKGFLHIGLIIAVKRPPDDRPEASSMLIMLVNDQIGYTWCRQDCAEKV
jgi:hypothetical protein